MAEGLDFLAVVSRPDFPSGTGPVGDYYNLRGLLERRTDWHAAVLELNSHTTEISWDDTRFIISQEGLPPFDLGEVRTALFLPICLEVEETLLCRVDRNGRWPRFAEEQWRPITAAFEDRLSHQRCLNPPDRVRATNNKLLQFERLRKAGFALPGTAVSSGRPVGPVWSREALLVAKNVSEGGWKSADGSGAVREFSPARLVGLQEPTDPWPVIWQDCIEGSHELRCFVMGDDVIAVDLLRDPDVLDVRSTNNGRPVARLTEISPEWTAMLRNVTRCLGLQYAVIDAIPNGDDLHLLEVNANGVWWFLPDRVAGVLEARFHAWLEREVDLFRSGDPA